MLKEYTSYCFYVYLCIEQLKQIIMKTSEEAKKLKKIVGNDNFKTYSTQGRKIVMYLRGNTLIHVGEPNKRYGEIPFVELNYTEISAPNDNGEEVALSLNAMYYMINDFEYTPYAVNVV